MSKVTFNPFTSNFDISSSSGGGGGGANTALSNLASTAVNADIVPGVANTVNIGSSALPFQSIFAGTTFDLNNGNIVTTLTNNSVFWGGPIPAVVINSEVNSGNIIMFGSTDTSTPGIGTTQASIQSGDNNAASGWITTGAIFIQSGYQNTSGSTARTGDIFVLSGNGDLGTTGGVTIASGDGTTQSGDIQIHTGGATTRGTLLLSASQINTVGSIVPNSDNSYNLGDSTHKFNQAFSAIFKASDGLQSLGTAQLTIQTPNASSASSQNIATVTGQGDGGGNQSGNITFNTGGASNGATRGTIQFNAPQTILSTSHLTSHQSGTTSVSPNVNAGSGAASSLSNATDNAGHLSLTTGTASWASGIQTTVTFINAYGVAPIVQLTPTNANASAAWNSRQVFVSSTQNGFSVNFGVADSAQVNYTWNYQVIETQ